MCLVLVASALLVALGQNGPPGPGLRLEDAFALAAARSPAVRAARARLPVATAGLAVAGERLNPELRVEFERETPHESYGLALPLELGGKRGYRLAAGEAAVRTSEAALAAALTDLRVEVRRAYFASAVADQRLTVLAELHDLGARVRDAARERFDAGSAPRLELVQAELALSQVDNDVTAARATSLAARTALNALLGSPLDAASVLDSPLESGVPPDADIAVRQALAANGELTVLQRQVEEQTARVALARAMRIPDIVPEATLTRDAAPEFDTGWRAAVTLTLPILTSHGAGLQLEESALAAAQAELDAARARVTAAVTSAATLARAQRQQYLRYRDEILPRALEVERMAEDAYTLGQSGISEFLLALQATRDTRLRALLAASDYQNTLADLERAMGVVTP